MLIREYKSTDISAMAAIWNDVVERGEAFPQLEGLTKSTAADFFASQSRTAVAEIDSEIVGLYILHPNNIGRVGHICNCSYAVLSSASGKGVGSALVSDSLKAGKALGFRLMQFNAVVKSNHAAIHIYEKLGFVRLGIVPGGFCNKAGVYEDIILYYHTL